MSVIKVRNVALIGTGIMGAPIGAHILDAGFNLCVNSRTKSKAENLLAKGATWAASPAEAAQGADLILTMVGYPGEVEEVYLGKGGILDAAPKGSWMLDLTTSSPTLAQEMHDAAELVGKHLIDCPVTGGQEGAEAGSLTLMIGAREEECGPIVPVLDSFSAKKYFFGKAGAGQTAKLCNQVSLAACMMGYADALSLAQQSGLDLNQVIEVVCNGMGKSLAMERLAPKSVAGDFKPGFMAEHLRKDLGLALLRAEDLELTLPATETAFNLYDLLCTVGGAKMGTQAISLLYADEESSKAAGLDWSLADVDEWTGEDEGEHECHCGHHHDHEGDHECHCGHHHDHEGDHECHCGHHHDHHEHGDNHECHCKHHHGEE